MASPARDFDKQSIISVKPVSSSSGSQSPDSSCSDTEHDVSDKPGFAATVEAAEGPRQRKGHSTFKDEGLGQFWKPLDTYEGAHRFDRDFHWEEEEEKKLVKKVCAPVSKMVPILLQTDLTNVTNDQD